jgi:hypothetical protein
VDDQTAEQWVQSHQFSEPLRLAEVEAGVLTREPVAGTGLPLWVRAVGAVGWIFVGIAFLLGAGASLLGLLAAWLAGRDAAGGSGLWMGVTQLVYVCSAFAYAFYLVEVVRARRRQVHDMVFAAVTVVASAATFMVLRSSPETVPGLVSLAVVITGVLGAALLVASIMSEASRPTDDTRKPPLRGPSKKADHERYLHTRELALDIVVDRGLVKIDDLEKARMNNVPLGYWDELDGVDERERRRILEYAVIGWRTFSDADRRVWSPPAQRP